MKKTVVIFVLLLSTAGMGVFLYEKSEKKLQPAHTTTIYDQPYKPLGNLIEYFSGWSAASTTSLGYIVKTKFNGIAVGNLEKLRFDLPSSPEYKINPHLQYYHPHGGMGKIFYDIKGGFAAKEVLPESNILYTFGNRLSTRKTGLGIQEKEIPDQDVFAIVTHVRPEMCSSATQHDVNILPWPKKMEVPSEIITFEHVAMCFQHPAGWYYYVWPAYVFTYIDAYENKRSIK